MSVVASMPFCHSELCFPFYAVLTQKLPICPFLMVWHGLWIMLNRTTEQSGNVYRTLLRK